MSRSPSALLAIGASLLCVPLIVLVYVAALGDTFGNTDEVVYAEFVRAMVRTGDYFTLRYHDAILLQRPALPVTLYALVSRLVTGEAGLRIGPAFLSALAALAAGAIVWRRTGLAVAAAAAALFCAGVPTFHVYGRALFSDPPFVLACVGALGATLAAQRSPRAFVWAGACLGLAIAMKSLAAAPLAVGLAPWLFVALRRHGRAARPFWTLLAFLGLAAPFFVVGVALHGRRFIDEHIIYNLFDRARGLEGIGLPGPLAYITHLWRADGPVVTVALLGALPVAGVVAARERDPVLGAAAGTAATVLAVLSLLGTRLPHYLLSFIPAAAVCVGLLLARLPRLAPAGALAAAALFYVTSGRPGFDGNLAPVPAVLTLGRAAAAATSPRDPVYSLDWYAPALGYYADRRWHLLATSEDEVRIVGSVDLFKAAGNVHRAPPWPAGPFLVAGTAARLAASGLPRVRLVARDGDVELWETR